MAWFRRRAIVPRGDGRYDVRFNDDVRDLLASLAGQMVELLTEARDDPALKRLFPTAYTDDPFRDAEYQVLSGDRLRDGRLTAYEQVAATSAQTVLTEDELQVWMRALNDVRLVLGTRLDVSEDDELLAPDADPDDPEVQARWLYETLGQLQYEIIEALADGLPDVPDDEQP